MKARPATRGQTSRRKPAKQVQTKVQLAELMSTNATLLVGVSLVVIVFLVFANSMGNEFVFDDIYLITTNKQIQSLNLPLLLSSYRPIRDISYAVDFALWGEQPFG